MSIQFLLKNIYSLISENQIAEDKLPSLEDEIQQLIGTIANGHASPEEFKQFAELSDRLRQIALNSPNFPKLIQIDNAFGQCIGRPKAQEVIVPTVVPSVTAPTVREAQIVPDQDFAKVPRPIRDNPINQVELEAWIEAYEIPKCKQALKQLSAHIVHISQDQFEQSLQSTVQHLNQYLKDEGGSYVLAVEDGKSNRWVAQLACSNLLYAPDEEVSLVFSVFLKKYADAKAQNPETIFPKSVVLFDDAAYSGEQLTRVTRNIFNDIDTFNKNPKNGKIQIPNIIIACPYMTQFAEMIILKSVGDLLIEEGDITVSAVRHLKILPFKRIMTIKELIVDADVLATLTQMWWPTEANLDKGQSPEGSPRKRLQGGSPRNQSPRGRVMSQAPRSTPMERDLSPLQFAHKKGVESRGTVYFAFKIPDKDSFVAPLAEGKIVVRGNISQSVRQFHIIPKTVPPYKPNFEAFCKEIAENQQKS